VRVVLAHTRSSVLELLRYPSFSVPTLAFPALFFLLFVSFRADEQDAGRLVASFAGFGVLSVALFHFGVGIAGERTSPWERYLRTLPLPPPARFASRTLVAVALALPAAGAVCVVASLTTPVHLEAHEWLALAGALLAGAVPLALLGIALGYWLTPRGALPLANALFLLLAYCGGLWAPPHELPRAVELISPLLPTRQFGELLWAAAEGRGPPAGALAGLAVYALVFALVGLAGYRRDEGARFT
jgi:ABC-2 type transport system permease protein